MTDATAQHPKLFHFLTAIDGDLAAKSRVQGCGFCGGLLHSARYPRKPRGGPMQVPAASGVLRRARASAANGAGGERLPRRFAFSGDGSIQGSSWSCWERCSRV